MGVVIHKGAAIADILADVRATLAAAERRGGVWASEAERWLAPAAARAEAVEAALAPVAKRLDAARLDRQLAEREADLTVGRVYDDLRDALGRPAADPDLTIAFPKGGSTIVKAPIGRKAERLAAAAKLIGALEGRIEPEVVGALAEELSEAAGALEPTVEAEREAREALFLASTTRDGTVRAAQICLSRLKKAYRAHGFSEADIHRVIPDRSSERRRAAPTAAASPAPAPVALVEEPTDVPGDGASAEEGEETTDAAPTSVDEAPESNAA